MRSRKNKAEKEKKLIEGFIAAVAAAADTADNRSFTPLGPSGYEA